ncbi:hypothetical protein [Crenothrix sp.]
MFTWALFGTFNYGLSDFVIGGLPIGKSALRVTGLLFSWLSA